MIKLKAIRHTGIRISNVDKAKEFYGRLSG